MSEGDEQVREGAEVKLYLWGDWARREDVGKQGKITINAGKNPSGKRVEKLWDRPDQFLHLLKAALAEAGCPGLFGVDESKPGSVNQNPP